MRQHNQIGDMLCSLTLYKALKKKHPDARITLVAAKTNYEIPFFDINPFIDRVIVFDKSSLLKIILFIKSLRSLRYDLGIVPSTIVLSRTSHIINWLSGAKKRVGVKSIDDKTNESQKYLNIKSDFIWKNIHQRQRNLQVVKQIGCDLSESEINSINFTFSENEERFGKEFISNHFPDKEKKIIAFHPGAGKDANRWDKNNFIDLIKTLYGRYQNYVLLTSGWTDNPIVGSVSDTLKKLSIPFVILHNAPIKKLASVLSAVDLYITNDTGTMHIAGYSGARMISIFGPTDPKEWAPGGINQKFIKSPDGNINSIPVEQVYSMACDMFEKNKVRK